MKITHSHIDVVRINHRGNWAFLHLHTDSGLTGLGELNPSVERTGNLEIARKMAARLVGHDPRNIEAIFTLFDPPALNPVELRCLSGIDQALWDLLGKSLNTPVYTLLGGACREQIRLYANINRATTDRTPEGFARNAAAAVADGFGAVKLAPFDQMPRHIDSAAAAEPGIACLRAVRQAIGPEADLLVDCHSHFTAKGALEVAEAIGELNMFWFEEPVPDQDIEGYIQVKANCPIPIAGGESRRLRQGFWSVLERRTLDILMPDVTVMGGIGELKKVAAMAECRGIPTAPHGPFGPLTIAAQVHAMASHPDFLILEYAWGEIPWRDQLTLPAEKVVDGHIALPQGPGLGLELNPEMVQEYRVEG